MRWTSRSLSLTLLMAFSGVARADDDTSVSVDFAAGGSLLAGGSTDAGGTARAGWLRHRDYVSRTPCDHGLEGAALMLVTFGMACIPKHAAFGNERGLALLGGVYGGGWMVGVAPQLRVRREGSRWRSPSIAHFALPEVGVAHFDDALGVTPYARVFRVPTTFWPGERAGIEVEPSMMMIHHGRLTPEGPVPSVRFWLSVSIVPRRATE